MKHPSTAPLCFAIFLWLSAAKATQIPFIGQPQATNYASLDASSESWKLSERPGVNSTSNLIFDTVNSLLQHWPNTRYRNGHNIVPATIPRGTLLYHGTYKNQIPSGPEWLSFGPDHSYYFCRKWYNMPGDDPNSGRGCYYLTMVATRPLKLMYFDGSSGAKVDGGPMDAQDLITWGKVDESRIDDESERIQKLCDWGKRYELDGFVRMQADFELMLCNFTAGVKPVSFLNIVSAGWDFMPSSSEPSSNAASPNELHRNASNEATVNGPPAARKGQTIFRTVEGGSWANHSPGETRIQLDYTRILSFYDRDSFPGVHASRSGKERWDHRLEAITEREMQELKNRLDDMFSDSKTGTREGSGVDWKALFNFIFNKFAQRLEVLEYILSSPHHSSDTGADSNVAAEDILKKAHIHVRSMISTYILTSTVPPLSWDSDSDHEWATPAYKLCATTQTEYLLEFASEAEGNLTPSEKLLLSAAKGVSKEICRVLTNIWADGQEMWTAGDEGEKESSENGLFDLEGRLNSWKKSISDLKAWLDWSVWVKCQPACSFEEICYLSTWPYFLSNLGQGLGENGSSTFTSTPVDDGWEHGLVEDEAQWRRPKPRCIRRVEPFTM